ncbi:MAG TPA: hypothetical protein VEI02_02355 [Planctomycetota bacterium]|nr:hypothetical protein [Planctomycetota bacterium]
MKSLTPFFRAFAVLALVAATSVAQLGFITINELDSDTPGTDALEFVEFYTGIGNQSLAGYTVVFYNGANNQSYFAMDLTGTSDANGFYVIGNAGVVPAPSQTFNGNLLQNGQDGVALYFGTSAAAFPNNTPVATIPPGGVLVDALVYGTNDPSAGVLLAALLPGQQQIDEGDSTVSAAKSVGRCADGMPNALDVSLFTQMNPTPGTFNSCVAPFRIDITQPCGGPITMTVTGASPNAELFNLIALTCSNPTGSGILFGINADLAAGSPLSQLQFPLGAAPFHVLADATGAYSITIPTSGQCPSPVQIPVEAISLEVVGYALIQVTPQTSGCRLLDL